MRPATANLFGRVPFGRGANNDPRMIISQLLYLISLFFVLLGATIVTLEVGEAVLTMGDNPVQGTAAAPSSSSSSGKRSADRAFSAQHKAAADDGSSTRSESAGRDRSFDAQMQRHHVIGRVNNYGNNENGESDDGVLAAAAAGAPYSPAIITPLANFDYRHYLHANFYVGFDSLFVPTAIGESASVLSADAKFFLAHIFTAVVISYPAALCVERRKFVMDFIASMYMIYVLMAAITTKSLIQPFAFWFGVLVSFVIAYVGTSQIAYKREMAEVLISNEREDNNASASPTSNGANIVGGAGGAQS